MSEPTNPTAPRAGRDLALLRFSEALAERLPGSWTATDIDVSTGVARSELDARLWDNAVASWALGTFVYDRAGIVKDSGERSLVVLPRPYPHTDQYVVAALLPAVLGSAYDFEDLAPHGIVVDASPARAAFAVRMRLLPRYTDALHTALSREIAAYIPSTAELAGDRPAAVPLAAPVPVYVPDGSRWQSDPRDTQLLREAVRDLLRIAALRFDEEQTGISDVLAGGGEFLCDRNDLDPDLAPIIEAAALTTALDAAGLRVHSVLDPALPEHLQRFESWPADRQRAAIQQAAGALDPPAVERPDAARARSASHPAAPIRLATDPPTPTAALPAPGHRPARPTV
ncbi:hypothetical protein [Kitasatospora sp. NPDC057015]|uniref:hypothetical protein n=1 Tax=Kitasatospora sp. NPDC057015 TaxID=3346001 RepID=UPI0036371621